MPLGRTSVGDTRSWDGNGRHGRQGKHPAIEFVAACIVYGIVDEDGNIRVWEVDTNRGMASEGKGWLSRVDNTHRCVVGSGACFGRHLLGDDPRSRDEATPPPRPL